DDLVPSSKKRVQLWPEVLVRSATTLPGDVTSGKVPATEFDPVTGETRSSPELIHRAQDLAGMAGGTSFGAAAGHVIPENALGMAGGKLQIRPMSKEAIHQIGDASFNRHYVEPLQNVPIETLTGSHLRPERVAPLAERIKENGWIEPLVVDQAGNVLEGQHRLRALEGLGVKEVPVHRVVDLESVPQFASAKEAALAAGAHSEQAQAIAGQVAEIVRKEGVKALPEYEAPRGFERPWAAAVRAASLLEDSALPGAPLAALERNATRAPHMAGRKLRDSFGEGWFYNPKQGKLHKIEASDLGPHGDHDGWISIGDNAERVGVDPKAAAAMQVATWGAHPDSPNPLIREFAEKHPPVDDFGTPQTHSYGNVENPTAYDRDFLQTFGIDPNTALDPARLGLTRVRKWPDGTLSVSAYSPSVNPRKLVSELIKSDPEVMTGVKSVGVESLDGNFRNLTPEQFLQGDWGTRSRTATFREDAATPGAPLAALERNAARAPHMAMEEAPTGNLPAPYKPQELGSDVQNFLRLSQGFEKKYGPDWVTRLTPEESAALR
ncbi:MAG TPA: ParB N-terminal domain-containing protein, partial [Candidatus Paceibacterota bacterium]|nr:ParB N-terminal domain-containing protein [Candidatus Paceibacterota bacterium]